MHNIILGAGILAAAVAGGLLESWREQRYFKVTHNTVEVSQWECSEPEITLVFLSDLHNKIYGMDNENLFQAIKDVHPDLILIGGDMLVGKKNARYSYEPALRFVSRLPQICPVYYANGNHEQRMKESLQRYENALISYKKQLQEAGVQFLENAHTIHKIRGRNMQITGLELPMETYRKFRKPSLTPADIERCVGKKNGNHYQILLAHNPSGFPAYKAWGADLVLSGHLHGGIVRLPGIGGVITPQAVLFPKYSGEMTKEEGHTIIVSRGLGTHTVNLRFLNEAELVVIHLKGCR